jgi:hypothetical protein
MGEQRRGLSYSLALKPSTHGLREPNGVGLIGEVSHDPVIAKKSGARGSKLELEGPRALRFM